MFFGVGEIKAATKSGRLIQTLSTNLKKLNPKVIAKAIRKIKGKVNKFESIKGAKGLIGTKFEDFLHKNLPNAKGSFSKGGRDFDGMYNNGKIWFVAKS